MEGRFRPGHFNGVCQIVSKLFMIVNPTRAYFGEKDFQQLAIIREMVKQIEFNGLEIVGCPIVREEDGLALSSRNARLSAVEREYALNISQTLFKSCTFAKSHPVAETQKFVEDAIAAAPGLRLEYLNSRWHYASENNGLGRYGLCSRLHYGILRRGTFDR